MEHQKTPPEITPSADRIITFLKFVPCAYSIDYGIAERLQCDQYTGRVQLLHDGRHHEQTEKLWHTNGKTQRGLAQRLARKCFWTRTRVPLLVFSTISYNCPESQSSALSSKNTIARKSILQISQLHYNTFTYTREHLPTRSLRETSTVAAREAMEASLLRLWSKCTSIIADLPQRGVPMKPGAPDCPKQASPVRYDVSGKETTNSPCCPLGTQPVGRYTISEIYPEMPTAARVQ